MLPKITELEIEMTQTPQEQTTIKPSFQYDFERGDFVLKDGRLKSVDGIESLKVWIVKAIKTERYRFRIYDGVGYGTTIEDLIGTNFPRQFIESELRREIISSLTEHPLIENITNWKFERVKELMNIYFTVETVNGSFEMEVRL